MPKTLATKVQEELLYNAIHKIGTFCCFEVTIGFMGKERVDMLSYDTKGIFRCFEIKTSVQDFHSSAKKTFLGHYNYFVLTNEVYEKVKDEIPKDIGIYISGSCIKKAKKQAVSPEMIKTLKDSLIRSYDRVLEKEIVSENEMFVTRKNREIAELKNQVKRYRELYHEMILLYEPNGRRYNEKSGILEMIRRTNNVK